MASMPSVVVNGSPMNIYVDAPSGSERFPAVMLMYHRDGLDDFTKGVAAKLKAAGYLVAVPDVSHRSPHDLSMKERKNFLKDSEVVADIGATIDFLRGRPDVDGDRRVIMGHCMGGRMALLGAGRVHEFRGAVVYYGGGSHLSWGKDSQTPFDTLRDIRCPVIGFFGNKDNNPSPEQVDQIDAEMTRHGITHDFHRYEDAGHGFQNRNPGTPGESAATKDSWAKTLVFLKSVLGR